MQVIPYTKSSLSSKRSESLLTIEGLTHLPLIHLLLPLQSLLLLQAPCLRSMLSRVEGTTQAPLLHTRPGVQVAFDLQPAAVKDGLGLHSPVAEQYWVESLQSKC